MSADHAAVDEHRRRSRWREALWAFGGVTLIKASGEDAGGRVMVSEQRAPRGVGSPLHVHHREDESFYVLEGEVTFWVGGAVIVAPVGTFVYGPRDIAHTFIVTSDEARFLLVIEPGDFTGFVRAADRPAPSLEHPPPPDSPPDVEALSRLAASYGIDIVGPLGIPS